jgi:ATP-dependent DNA helicase RecG
VNPAAKAPAGLDTSLQYLKGVGPQRARLLERLGLATVRDALNHFPRDYQDRREFVPFHKLPLGETGVVLGTVFGVAPPPRGSRAPVQVTFRDQTGYFTALWFGRGFLAQVFKRDQRVVLYGKKALAKDRRVVLESPDFEIVEEDELASIHMGRVVPVYSLTEGLFQRPMRTLLYQVVEAHAEQVPDILPGGRPGSMGDRSRPPERSWRVSSADCRSRSRALRSGCGLRSGRTSRARCR